MDARQEAARGLNDIEDFLYRKAHLKAAHRRVADFTARSEGLTEGQKTDIQRWFLEEQRVFARMVTAYVSDRITEAEEEHRASFGRWLRGTMIAMILITVLMSIVCVSIIVGTSH